MGGKIGVMCVAPKSYRSGHPSIGLSKKTKTTPPPTKTTCERSLHALLDMSWRLLKFAGS